MDISNRILSDITVFQKYAKYIPELNRRETWEELVTRNKQMHQKKYPQLHDEIENVYKFVYDKKVLPSMRSLQFGGKPIEISPNRVYNCFGSETEFITDGGLKKFSDFKSGDVVTVLTHTGNFKNAVVRNYGKQHLNEVTFHRGKSSKTVRVTGNHRWLLYDGNETTNLKSKDILYPTKKYEPFDYDNADPNERLYWCYGYVYGDGTIVRNKSGKSYSMVRLCGPDAIKYASRFEELGFKTSSHLSINGDIFVYTGTYQKTAPSINVDGLDLIRAFMDGYLSADAYKNPDWYSNKSLCKYKSIQSSDQDHQVFLESHLDLCGYFITNKSDLTGQTTNYGTRPETYKYSITSHIGSNRSTAWGVYDIVENVSYEDVWCLEVEDDKSFVLSGGIVTGNCAYAPIDDWRVFGEIMFLLLGGTGIGYSVQKHHVEKLPEIHKPRQDRERRFLVSDSIEGWADAVKALVKTYFVGGSSIRFDYSDIRPKGARLVTSGGKAPGAEPLRICIERLRGILDTKNDGDKLTPIEVHDMVCHIADAVLAGGIRRAALISLFSADDDEMISCKFGNWWELNPQRGRANNSAVLLRSKVTEEFFKELWKKIELSNAGEPGIYFSNDKDWGTNPSLRAGTKVLTTDGVFPIEQLDGKEFFVKNLNGQVSKAKCWLSGKNKQLYKLTLTGGHTYYATPEHEWPVWNGSEYVKVKTSEISSGDRLPIIREESLFNGTLGSYEDGFFIGWHLGDGWTSNTKDGRVVHGMVVSHTEAESIKGKLEEYFSNELNSSAKFAYRDNGTYELNTTLNSWNNLQTKFGYSKKDNGLPNAVWENGSEDFRKGVIDGLFSSDGSVSDDRIVLTTKHQKMANDVSELLGFYGIKTTIRTSQTVLNENVYTRYDVFIKEKHSMIHFRNIFKLSNSVKQERLNKLEYRYNIPDMKQIEIIDIELSDVVEDVWDVSVYDDTHCFQIAHAITGNCFSGDTKIAVADGRGAVSIGELAESGEDVPVYSVNRIDGKVSIEWARSPRKTRTNVQLVRVHLDDGTHLDVTPDHGMLLRDGTRVEAKDLKEGDSLSRFTKRQEYVAKTNPHKYWRVYCDTRNTKADKIYEHRMITKFYQPDIWAQMYDESKTNGWIKGALVVHHKDYNPLNNRPENLQIMTFKDHAEYHAQHDNKGENNSHYSGYTNEQIEKFALDLTKEYGRKVSLNEWESAVKQNGMPMTFSSWRRTNWFKSPASLLSWCASELGYDNVDPRVARQLGKLESNGYNAYIQDGAVWVKKSCGNPSCNEEMHLHHSDKHAVYCSKKCSASTEENISDFIKRSRAGQINKQQITFENQVKIFNDLKDSLGREPKKIEWESACKDSGVSGRIRTEIPKDYTNPYVFHTYTQLKETASTYNHKVISVQYLEGLHDVYNITVDNNHTVGIVTNDSGEQMSGVFVTQCCEIALRPFQFCNLCEVNVSDVVDQEDLEARTKAATFIGTLQASYTDFHYLRPVWQRTTEKEALLGVGMTGIGSGVAQKLDVKAAAKAAKEENERVSALLGINKAARVTTIKPSGTTSCVLGTSSGIHAWHDEYYLRRIRIGKNEALYPYLKENHPQLVEDEYFRPHDTAVVGVPQKSPDHAILRTESPIQLLERVKWFNQNWIRQGHRTGMNTHNISATVSIREHEWDAVGSWLWTNREFYNGISVLPYDGGSYIQSPFETITKEEYERLMETLHDVDLTKVLELDDNTEHSQEVACAGGACLI